MNVHSSDTAGNQDQNTLSSAFRTEEKIVKELMAEGIFDIRDIPEGKLSNSTHERVHRVTKSGKAEIDPSVVAVLKQFPYPGTIWISKLWHLPFLDGREPDLIGQYPFNGRAM